jgi:CheY-like chemotaxis protein
MESNPKPTVYRILLVEDDQERADILISYLPKDIRVVFASSAGRALGIVKTDHRNRRDKSPYCGIMLDHDLQEQIVCAEEGLLSGMNVVDAIIDSVSRDVPILIHSMNPSEAPMMVKKLKSAGFRVTRMPMRELTAEKLLGWLEDECEAYNDNP